MTDSQLYLVIGIQALLTLLSLGANIILYTHLSGVINSRFDALERRIDRLVTKPER